MATCALRSNGTLLPWVQVEVTRTPFFVGERKRMASNQLRSAGEWKMRLSYVGGPLTEAELTTWRNAHPKTGSFTHVDELGTSRTVQLMGFEEKIVESVPTNTAVLGSSGTTKYEVAVEVEEV